VLVEPVNKAFQPYIFINLAKASFYYHWPPTISTNFFLNLTTSTIVQPGIWTGWIIRTRLATYIVPVWRRLPFLT